MVPEPGVASVERLGVALVRALGERRIRWAGVPGPGVDAIGWRLLAAPRFVFSVSTHAGTLPDGVYDFQVSIVDDSLRNGDIVFLDDVGLAEVLDITARYVSGEVS